MRIISNHSRAVPPGNTQPDATRFDVEIKRLDHYLFQIAGPTALQVLEKAAGTSLRDVKFLRFRDISIKGIKTEIGRIGMTGGLAYELHGSDRRRTGHLRGCARSWAGIRDRAARLGHLSGQSCRRRLPARDLDLHASTARADPAGDDEILPDIGFGRPSNTRARMRTPVEVRWHNMAKFDHDFIGREALAAEIANPKRTMVTLRWNPDDVTDTYASLTRPGIPLSKLTCLTHRSGGRWHMRTMSERTAAKSAILQVRSTVRTSASFSL